MSPAQATEAIRSKARDAKCSIAWTMHAKEQMSARQLLMGDALYVLKEGFVYEPAESASQIGLYKYKIECQTPNSNGRTVRVVAIPSNSCAIKIVTVMWRDES
jgi:hypothetical protein